MWCRFPSLRLWATRKYLPDVQVSHPAQSEEHAFRIHFRAQHRGLGDLGRKPSDSALVDGSVTIISIINTSCIQSLTPLQISSLLMSNLDPAINATTPDGKQPPVSPFSLPCSSPSLSLLLPLFLRLLDAQSRLGLLFATVMLRCFLTFLTLVSLSLIFVHSSALRPSLLQCDFRRSPRLLCYLFFILGPLSGTGTACLAYSDTLSIVAADQEIALTGMYRGRGLGVHMVLISFFGCRVH